MKYYVYKYVSDDQIIYIGKTNDIVRRIKEHASGVGLEAKFTPYSDAEIYYHICGNATEMDALESLLINYYKPLLNDIDVEPGEPTVELNIPWNKYNEYDTDADHFDALQEYKNCLKQITANRTRILAYHKEQDTIRKELNKMRGFYLYLERNKDFIVQCHNESMGIDEKIFVDGPVRIGNKTIKKWYDDVTIAGGILWVKFSAEFLQAFFGVMSNKHWIESTLDAIGGKRLKEIDERVDGLVHKNELLKRNANTLCAIADCHLSPADYIAYVKSTL